MADPLSVQQYYTCYSSLLILTMIMRETIGQCVAVANSLSVQLSSGMSWSPSNGRGNGSVRATHTIVYTVGSIHEALITRTILQAVQRA